MNSQTLAAVFLLGALVLAEGAKLTQEQIRASLITKHNFMRHRQQKSDPKLHPRLPKPFLVTTSYNVQHTADPNRRRARTWQDSDGSTVVEGIRVPDDESDRVTWRNGRVVNNVFVPYTENERAAKAAEVVAPRQGKSSDLEDQVKSNSDIV